eukprot:gene3198-5514_t
MSVIQLRIKSIITNAFKIQDSKDTTEEQATKVANFYDTHKKKAENFQALYTIYLNPHRHATVEGTLTDVYLQMILTNAFLIYRNTNKSPLSHKDFLSNIASSLLQKYRKK